MMHDHEDEFTITGCQKCVVGTVRFPFALIGLAAIIPLGMIEMILLLALSPFYLLVWMMGLDISDTWVAEFPSSLYWLSLVGNWARVAGPEEEPETCPCFLTLIPLSILLRCLPALLATMLVPVYFALETIVFVLMVGPVALCAPPSYTRKFMHRYPSAQRYLGGIWRWAISWRSNTADRYIRKQRRRENKMVGSAPSSPAPAAAGVQYTPGGVVVPYGTPMDMVSQGSHHSQRSYHSQRSHHSQRSRTSSSSRGRPGAGAYQASNPEADQAYMADILMKQQQQQMPPSYDV